MKWIFKWHEIDNEKRYLVCSINNKIDKSGYYLANPNFYDGWSVKRLRQGCYAATEYIPPSHEELVAAL